MGIHPQSDSFVCMPQLFRHTGDVRAVGNGDAGKAVPELVGVQILDTIHCGKKHFEAPDNGIEMQVATDWHEIKATADSKAI